MKKNLGKWDRLLRIIAGTVIMVISLYYQSWWALLGLALLVNGLSGRCGGYALLGISSAKPVCDTDIADNNAK